MYAEACQNGCKKRQTQYNRKRGESNKTIIRQDVPSQEDVIFETWVKAPHSQPTPFRQTPKVVAFLCSGEL